MSNVKAPNRFVGLHCHTSFSTFDGLGYPDEHIDFVISEKQGMDAWALTDHGNGSGLAHARAHTQKVQKQGKKYRQLYGVEFYFVPSLKEWFEDYSAHKQAIKDAKSASKAEKLARTNVAVDAEKEVEQGGHVIEDENETKRARGDKPEWKRYYHLVVIAKNRTGLGNLFTLVKKSYKHGFYRFPRIDFDLLKQHSEGLLVSTACVGGLASGLIYKQFPDLKFNELTPNLLDDESTFTSVIDRLENMTDRFVDCVGRDNFFLEIQHNELSAQHLTNRALLKLSEKTGIKLISTADSHFPNPEAWQARELYKKLGWIGANIDQSMLPKLEEMKTMLYPKNAQQMWDEYQKGKEKYDFYNGYDEIVRDSIERTHDIAWDMCEDTWVDTSVKLPNYNLENQSAFSRLSSLVKTALVDEGLADNKEYVERAKLELSDIKYLGHEAYFLSMYEIFNLSKKKTLIGPGRGSGAGSLVNYLLGITQVDPIPYGLLWSRFLGRHRASWPDIDTDAGDRDVLIESARTLFGEDSVVPVSNFNTLKLKSLVKDIAKFYNVPFNEVNKVTGPLQDQVFPFVKDQDVEKGLFVLKHEDCMKYSSDYREFMEKYPDVEQHVKVLFMENRSIGRHAGGVIIAPAEELEKSMPIIGVRGELQTPWTEGMNFRHLEDNGFLKFDFLGLTLLRDVQNCIQRILISQGNPSPSFADITAFFDEHLNCRYNKQDDQKVWKHVYEKGHFSGVFQFTAPGARKFCLEAKPTSVEELAALTAIYRPGPLKANVHKKYVAAKKNSKNIQYDHPAIEKVLGPTYNFVVFQEQFMLLAQDLAGFTPGESDKLRKTLVKKSLGTAGKVAKEKASTKEKFISGAEKLHGISRHISENLWDTIEAFSKYGFNKSHAVAYAIDSYYAAWLHTHYEKEWLATILQSEDGNQKALEKTIAEIKSYGYKFAAADINYSGDCWVYSEDAEAFVPPLTSVKGVGSTAMDEIMSHRPFKSLQDFLYNEEGAWRYSKANKTTFSSLCRVEALTSLEEFSSGELKNHRQLYAMFTEENNYATLRKGLYGITPRQYKKAVESGDSLEPLYSTLLESFRMLPDWSRTEKIINYNDLVSAVSNNLLFPERFVQKITNSNMKSACELPPGERDIVWFCITKIIQKKTKNNKDFYRFKVVDNKNNTIWVRCWGRMKIDPELFSLWVANVHNDPNWGLSTSSHNMRKLTVFDK